MNRFLFICLLAFRHFCADAHHGNLSGVVYDHASGLPLHGVSVQISGLNKATFTNELGQFRFDNLVAAQYKIELSHLGFQSQILHQIVQDDQTAFVKIELTALEVSLSEVIVSSVRAHDQQLISNLDIKLRPITNSQEILRMVPGLFIGQHAGGGKAEQIFYVDLTWTMEPTFGLR